MTKAYHTIIKLFQKLAVTNVDQIHMFNSWRIKTQRLTSLIVLVYAIRCLIISLEKGFFFSNQWFYDQSLWNIRFCFR